MTDQNYPENQQHGQPQYPNQQYPHPGYGHQVTPEQMKGQQLSTTSMVLGIISLFVAGIILGPMAIVKASQSEKLIGQSSSATAGKVTGWIGAILGIFVIIYFVFIFVVLGIASTTADFEYN